MDEPNLGLDPRAYIPVNYGFIPPFEPELLEETEEYEIVRDRLGIVTKALKAGAIGGARMCMDQHLEHPVKTLEDWEYLKKRLVAALPERYPDNLDALIATWKQRDYLRIWGGVAKRVLARGPDNIRAHLSELIPLIEEGGFIPTVDHTAPPDVSWDNFRYYMDNKRISFFSWQGN